jgi:hypothetical protein
MGLKEPGSAPAKVAHPTPHFLPFIHTIGTQSYQGICGYISVMAALTFTNYLIKGIMFC